MFGPLFAVFAQRIGGSLLDIVWAWSAYLIVTGILTILIGRFSDRGLSKEKLMVAGYALNAVFTFGYLFVSSPLQLLMVQIGLGVAVALAYPTWEALYAKYEDKRNAGYEWGLASGEYRLVTGVAIVMGGLIVTYASFQALFLVMGVIQVVAALYQAQILRR